jgi:hypothetical protein
MENQREARHYSDKFCSQLVPVGDDAVLRCNRVHRCGADIVFEHARPRFLPVEERRLAEHIAGHDHLPHVGPEGRNKWVRVNHD